MYQKSYPFNFCRETLSRDDPAPSRTRFRERAIIRAEVSNIFCLCENIPLTFKSDSDILKSNKQKDAVVIRFNSDISVVNVTVAVPVRMSP